ncbi:hypothetical protein [Streptomyces sp. UNOB3_S3]|uniref:hypothetical protein n=1 Tax=Streptomyces sp. UNOB3_S3 TaxID=2871682 RepID=UPI001E4BCFFB|nr:hypothetical protein [Streptomyces sp. UNOB3_S3]MCC3775071.1 hypothetical protein [Streptomyces sp. UNOB3_S3]
MGVINAVQVCVGVFILLVMPRAFRQAFLPFRLVKVALLAALITANLWTAHARGPAWFVVALYADLGVSGVFTAVSWFGGRFRARSVEPLRLSHFIQQSARFDGPQWIGLMAAFTGTLFVTVEQPRIQRLILTLAGAACPLCFVEDQLRRILGDDTPVVAEYRAHLRAGSNRHIALWRPSASAAWEVKMLTRDTYKEPLRALACPVHGPLTIPSR